MKKYQVLVSRLAENEIYEIEDFINKSISFRSANTVTEKIWQVILSLGSAPRRGTEFKPGTNIWISRVRRYKYYLLYEIDDNAMTVTVHHVIHQHRDLNRFIHSI